VTDTRRRTALSASVLTAALVLGGCSGARSASSTTTTAATTRSTAARGSTTTTAPGMGWSSPVPVSPGNSLGAVDCPTTGFCLALDQRGDASRFDGSTWSSAGTTGTGATGNPSLTCAGPTFCVAVAAGANQMARWTGTAFAGQVTLPAQGLQAVGCATPAFCVTVDNLGGAYYFDGSTWSAGSNDWGSVTSISCPTAAFCVSAGGGISTWNGQAWSEPQPFGLTSVLTGVSCPSATFCQVVDNTGQVETWNGTTWTGPVQVPSPGAVAGGSATTGPDLSAVSCASPTFCVAVAGSGAASTWDGSTWSTRTVDPASGLTSVSCASPTLCVAVDEKGDAVVYR
jgi:hypothetical protein